ncbi:MAG: TIGR00366 family protein [Chitinophagales bacterium]|nr:TIGR00366 family protein [Chitinophagales bacterium]
MADEEKSSGLIRLFKALLPSPLTIAIALTILTFVIALILTKPEETNSSKYFLQLAVSWEKGLWDSSGGGLYFAFQMMLILVLGHILALTPLVNKLIQTLLRYCTTTANSAAIVAFGAIALSLVNWGLGLIFGAIIARKVGEKFSSEQKPLNYGLIGAAAYASMMTWHGGLSGSATTKSMEEGYIPEMMKQAHIAGNFPHHVPFDQTIGSNLNLIVTFSCLVLIPLLLYFIGKRSKDDNIPDLSDRFVHIEAEEVWKAEGAERLDDSRVFGISIGVFIICLGIYEASHFEGTSTLGFIQLNFINFMFLGLSFILHQSVQKFSNALQIAIGDVSGILIQFPFYFGILDIMQASGLISVLSNSITSVATTHTLPFLTFLSAGLVNFFVPSGGGQWAIQGPIIIDTVQQLGADLPKSILAMAYGDQWTNMLQPFWALPLLGITKLKPQQLIPYSFLVFLLGGFIFGIFLLII